MEVLHHIQDLEGRIDNLNWKPGSEWALPILEAVSNSLHATEYLDPKDRSIQITLVREGDAKLNLVTDKQKERPIIGFRVEDNGVGFNAENFKAFSTIDTRHKKEQGGKGIGRLFWLKAFSTVNIMSIFSENGNSTRRKINFKLDTVEHEDAALKGKFPNRTIVEVMGIKSNYKRYYFRLTTALAKIIADEFLPYFILKGWPEVLTISFTGVGEGLVAVKEVTNYDSSMENFKIKNFDFQIIHVKNYQGDSHRVFLCAADRTVSGYKPEVTSIIPKKILSDHSGKSFWYMGLVSSQYLTEKAATERSGFLIPDNPEDCKQCDMNSDLSMMDIDLALKRIISIYLKESYKCAQNETIKNIGQVIKENPELGVVSYTDNDVQDLLASNENDIKKAFRQKLYDQLDQSKNEIKSVLERIGTDDSSDFTTFETEFKQEVEKFSLLNQSHIVSYILYRKHVLELFERALTVFSGEKIKKESFIHNLIFPMRQQGKPSDFGTNHNLWLLDDRLSMVDWIASDVPLSKHDVLVDCRSTKEPDIVFYNLAYADDSDIMSASGYSEIHIVEFKRPFILTNNPIEQVIDYIFDIKNSKVLHLKDESGVYKETQKKIRVSPNAIFYGYIVFDLSEVRDTEKWRKMAHGKLKPFMNGYIYHNDDIIIFVNSFENVLDIAKKRNEIFFKKLMSTFSTQK